MGNGKLELVRYIAISSSTVRETRISTTRTRKSHFHMVCVLFSIPFVELVQVRMEFGEQFGSHGAREITDSTKNRSPIL